MPRFTLSKKQTLEGTTISKKLYIGYKGKNWSQLSFLSIIEEEKSSNGKVIFAKILWRF